nr:hypothetical protein [Tanacetum cinerariifolium]
MKNQRTLMSVVGLRWQPAGDDGEVVWWSGEDCDNGSVVGWWSGTGGDDGDGLEMVGAAVVVVLDAVAASGGEWYDGSNRSEWGEHFWGSPEKSSGDGELRRR